MAKSSGSSDFLATEFCHPQGKSGPMMNVSFAYSDDSVKGDFLSGPDGLGKVEVSASPVKGPGFGDSKVVGPGDPGRHSNSYGSGS